MVLTWFSRVKPASGPEGQRFWNIFLWVLYISYHVLHSPYSLPVWSQDTVVAIEALSKYARMTFMEDIDLRTWLEQSTPEDPSYHLSIDTHNRMVVERWPVTDLPREDVRVGVTGIGCILLQVTWHTMICSLLLTIYLPFSSTEL